MEERFWQELARVGKEVLEMAADTGHGFCMLDIKIADNKPVAMIRYKASNLKYPTNGDALKSIGKQLADSVIDEPDGSLTFTITKNKGTIKRVIVDNYRNDALR